MVDRDPTTPQPEREPVSQGFEDLVKRLIPESVDSPDTPRSRDFIITSPHAVEFFRERFKRIRAQRAVNSTDNAGVFVIDLLDGKTPVWTLRDEPSTSLQILRNDQLVVGLSSVEGDKVARQQLIEGFSGVVGLVSDRLDAGKLSELPLEY